MKISLTIKKFFLPVGENIRLHAWIALFVVGGVLGGCAYPSRTPAIPSLPTEGQTSMPTKLTIVEGSESIPLAVTSTGIAPVSRGRISTTSSVSETVVASEVPFTVATLTPVPIASALIQYGTYSQQPGWVTDAYVGKNTPSFALYSDGILLIRSEKYINGIEWYASVRLDPSQVCWLLNQIAHTGIYEMQGNGILGVEDPIYQFDQSFKLPDTGDEIVDILKISAEKSRWVQFIPDSRRWLAEPLKKVLDLLDAYVPPGNLHPYVSPRLLLWIERGRGSYEYATRQPPSAKNWPQNLPTISDLLGDHELGKVLLSGKEAEQVQILFNYRPVGKLFAQNGQEFFVIARPLLPDETPDKLSVIPTQEENNPSVFTCNGD